MSVKLHEAFCMDSFMDRLLWFDDFHGDQIQDEWRASGTVAVVDAQTGGIVRLTTGAVAGNNAFIDWLNVRSLRVANRVTAEYRVKANQVTYITVFLRLLFDGSNIIDIYAAENAGGATNWQAQCISLGATTSVDTGIALDTNYHIFRIECFPTDEVHFYIDGVECANSPITTNIPTQHLQPICFVQTNEDAIKTLDVDYVYIRQER